MLKHSTVRVAMTPYRSRWRRGLSKPEQYLRRWENNEPRIGRVVVQERRAGTRIRVMATKTSVLLVVGRHAVDGQLIASAGELAKSVVRMIPQLNWAFVEVLVSDSPSQNLVFLEGILYSPMILPRDLVLAGSVENATDYIIELGEAPLPSYKSGNKAVKKAQHQAASLSQRARQQVRNSARKLRAWNHPGRGRRLR